MNEQLSRSEFSIIQRGNIFFVEGPFSFLEFTTSNSPDVDYRLWNLRSKRRGEGKKVIRAFVEHIGANKRVRGMAVIEPHSINRLKNLGITEFAIQQGKPIHITSPATIKSLKLTRVLIGGGLIVDSVIITPHYPSLHRHIETEPEMGIEILCHT